MMEAGRPVSKSAAAVPAGGRRHVFVHFGFGFLTRPVPPQTAQFSEPKSGRPLRALCVWKTLPVPAQSSQISSLLAGGDFDSSFATIISSQKIFRSVAEDTRAQPLEIREISVMPLVNQPHQLWAH